MRIKKINPTPEQLSEQERAAMLFIQAITSQRRHAPTMREIAAEIDLSLGATADLVKRLIEYGYLQRRTRYQSRRNLKVIRAI
jgi:DNA-binding MarR family transcriptional regulator